jgi:hypothetical protein
MAHAAYSAGAITGSTRRPLEPWSTGAPSSLQWTAFAKGGPDNRGSPALGQQAITPYFHPVLPATASTGGSCITQTLQSSLREELVPVQAQRVSHLRGTVDEADD